MKQNTKFMNLTIDLLSYHTYSGNEAIMYSFVKDELQKLGFRVQQDDIGNIYATRGKTDMYPLINAHMDIIFDVAKEIEDEVERQLPTKPYYYRTTKEAPGKHCKSCENVWDCCSMAYKDADVSWQTMMNKMCGTEGKALAEDCRNYIHDKSGMYNYGQGSESVAVGYDYGNTSYDDNWDDWYYGECKSSLSCYYPSMNPEQKKLSEEILKEKFVIKYDEKTGKIEGNKKRLLGGDDKCGMAIALQVARELPRMPMKILFTVKEELGCVGISHFVKNNVEWFKDVKYDITIDRRGNGDLLLYSCGKPNCTKAFGAKMAEIAVRSGIWLKIDNGTVADVIDIRDHVPESINISAGYHNPHSIDEYVDWWAMLGIRTWVKNIILEV